MLLQFSPSKIVVTLVARENCHLSWQVHPLGESGRGNYDLCAFWSLIEQLCQPAFSR